jgi:TRAP-type uncharacterized transport system substrate-binding protein
MKRTLWFVGLLACLALLAWPLVAVLLNPLPKGRIVMATGGAAGVYDELAQSYKAELRKYGVELITRPDIGGFYTLKSLVVDLDGDVTAGIVKGGFVGGQQGRLATEDERNWHKKDVAGMRSLGRLLVEPMWIFTRAGESPASLRGLLGKKLWLGERPLGARWVAYHLLIASGVDDKNTTFVDKEIDTDGHALTTGEADAAILLLPPEAPKVQQLLRNPALQLMSFAAEADAYINRFPYLTKLVLNESAIEFVPTTPKTSVTLLATTAAMTIRTDLHPALAQLLTYVVFHNPKSGFDKSGEPVLFYRPGEFPQAADSEFETHPAARQVQASRELPVLINLVGPAFASMGLPFAFTAFISEHGGKVLLALVPILSILLPLVRIAPAAYNWTIRRRLLVWYRRLKQVERLSRMAATSDQLIAARAELSDIDRGVSNIRVPLAFSSQLYDLHLHINVVRQRLALRLAETPERMAAE